VRERGRSRQGALVGTLLAALAFAGLPGVARASETRVEGSVVSLYGEEIVVDLSLASGAKPGAVVEVWRPLKLRHPVTGVELSDQFSIGRLKLTQVRDKLAFARPWGKLERPVQPGDVVVLARREPFPEKPAAPVAKPALPSVVDATAAPVAGAFPKDQTLTPAEREAIEIGALLESLRGKTVRARVRAYENYIRNDPNGRYAVVLWEEAQKLRQLVLLSSEKEQEKQPQLRAFVAPGEALAGSPLSLGVELLHAESALLHFRVPGETSYATAVMAPAGDGYFSATLEAARVRAPRLEYFIEAVGPYGRAVSVVADASEPKHMQVVDPPRPVPPARHDSVVTVWTDYAAWNLKENNDNTWQTEGYVGVRFRDTGIRALRTGFGVYRGRGGSLEELDDQNLAGRSVGLTYGYLEGEFGVSHFTGIVTRLAAGLEKDGVTGGMQLLLRLGNDRSTNLLLGGEVLGTVGLRAIVELNVLTLPQVPMLFRSEVTNQPAGVPAESGGVDDPDYSDERGEVGARIIAQVGYRFLPALVVSVRGSYQGRTINHAGPGVGGGFTYTW
jgi:hypothetical protein